MPPAYRNPNNDPPRLGEMIHVVSWQECPAIVCRTEIRDRQRKTFPATVFCEGGAEVRWLSYDDYDPTEDPVASTWHFDHQ